MYNNIQPLTDAMLKNPALSILMPFNAAESTLIAELSDESTSFFIYYSDQTKDFLLGFSCDDSALELLNKYIYVHCENFDEVLATLNDEAGKKSNSTFFNQSKDQNESFPSWLFLKPVRIHSGFLVYFESAIKAIFQKMCKENAIIMKNKKINNWLNYLDNLAMSA